MKKKNRGFTLAEMVIVVAIIAVVASMIIPKTRRALATAKDAKAIDSVATLRKVSQLYKMDNKKSFSTNEEGERGVLKVSDIQELVDKEYLMQRDGNFFIPPNSDEAMVKVGSVTTKVDGECVENIKTTYVYLVLEADGESISFFPVESEADIADLNSGSEKVYYDTKCVLWIER